MASRNSVPVVVFPLVIFFFIVYSFSEKAPYASFAKNATSAPPAGYYDYIIVGGGTAGCPLAATLSAAARVLVLERGGLPYDNPNVMHAAGFANSLADFSAGSAAQMFISTDGVVNHRGRVLGGGSAVNAGFYSRAADEYVRRVGWEARLVNESYDWVERKVAFEPAAVLQWQEAVREGLLEAGVTPYNGFTYQHLEGTKIGGSIFDEHRIRHSSADLLEYALPANINVFLHATVHRILFRTSTSTSGSGKGHKKPKAYGVVFKDSKGIKHMAYLQNGAKNEIIVSAGALGSPQVLMLSGIGPAQKLKAQGIEVVLDQPMVGQGMSDNPINGFVIPTRNGVQPSLVQVVGITHRGVYIEAISGPFDLSSFLNTPQYSANLGNQKSNINDDKGVIIQKVTGPLSKGYMELDTRDPNDNPSVTFNYFSDSRDLHKCVRGMKILERVVQSRLISHYRYPNSSVQSLKEYMLSNPFNMREQHKSAAYNMEQYCNDTVLTIWHYHGGCQVNRVVDTHYRVLGVHSLRVIDGSTFHYSPGTNPQATVMMLGRYMGQKILQQRRGGK